MKYFWPKKFSNKFVEHGIEQEENARKTYENVFNVKVYKGGLLISPAHPWLGYSADGRQSTISDILKECKFLRELHQELIENDFERRNIFCQWAQNQIAENEDFLNLYCLRMNAHSTEMILLTGIIIIIMTPKIQCCGVQSDHNEILTNRIESIIDSRVKHVLEKISDQFKELQHDVADVKKQVYKYPNVRLDREKTYASDLKQYSDVSNKKVRNVDNSDNVLSLPPRNPQFYQSDETKSHQSRTGTIPKRREMETSNKSKPSGSRLPLPPNERREQHRAPSAVQNIGRVSITGSSTEVGDVEEFKAADR
ncbi:hypothetical protein NQ315_007337 [Exocentrus adspersus]|uniref:YqaJ viral recombinase domain-containing protein n=1 Tax=Exocentrus adspersus TaxID=1586481 RepID=A0AAV8V671_9CUCU|nr:hypothetical protein NQ315_007337 [Exocentrus adspersus]